MNAKGELKAGRDTSEFRLAGLCLLVGAVLVMACLAILAFGPVSPESKGWSDFLGLVKWGMGIGAALCLGAAGWYTKKRVDLKKILGAGVLLLAVVGLGMTGGCAALQKVASSTPACQEYSTLAASIQRLAGLLPEGRSERAELLQGAEQLSAQAVLCALGQKTNAELLASWQTRADQIADERITATQTAAAATATTATAVAADPRDEVDLSAVKWVGDPAGVGAWPITVGLKVSITGNTVVMEMDRLPDWPAIDGSFGNLWLIAKIDGQLKGASWEWTGTDRIIKKSLNDLSGDLKIPAEFPSDWHMASGEGFCIAVTSLSRGRWEGLWRWEYFAKTGKGKDAHERTPFVKVIWP